GGEDAELRLWEMPPEVDELIKRLRGATDATTRAKTIEELGLYRSEARDAIPDLLSGLKEADAPLRKTTLAALGKIGRPQAAQVRLLVPLAGGDAGAEVRLYALESLAAVGPSARAGLDVLAAAMKDREAAVRIRAAAALGAIGSEVRATAYPLLIDALRDTDE